MERDTIFYLLKGESGGEREFISGVVVGGGVEDFVIQFRREIRACVEDEILLYFKQQRQFLKRIFKVQRVTNGDGGGTRMKLLPLGDEPRTADMRASERIPTISEALLAKLADEPDCVVIDVSMSGLAVMAGHVYERGDVLRFEMAVKDTDYHGEVVVCSAIQVREGRYRYGLKCNADAPGDNLEKSLPQLWVELQIKYLEIMTA